MGPKPSKGAEVSKRSEDSHKRRRTSPQSGNPRHGPGPEISTPGGQAPDKLSSRHSGAPFDASSLSDYELQKATTGFAQLGISAHAPFPSGTPAWESPLPASYYQPQISFPSSQRLQYGVYPIGQHEKYGAYPPYQPGQYPAYPSNQPGQYPAYPSNQPGQYNVHHSEHAHFQPKPIPPNPYLNHPPATGMGTAIAAPVGHQPETSDPTKSRRATAPQPSLGEEPRRQGRGSGQQQSRDWEDAVDNDLVYLVEKYDKEHDKWGHIAEALSKVFKQKFTPNDCHRRWEHHKNAKAASKYKTWSREEDEELVVLRKEYDGKPDKWTYIAQGMYRAGFTNCTNLDAERRWEKVLKAETRNSKPEDWSKEEDKRLTELVKKFDKWDTLNGWQEISEQMRSEGLHRVPENCRTRWQETLRGPAKIEAWGEDEVKLLVDFHSQYSIVELVDLLERCLRSNRSFEDCRQTLSRLSNGQMVDWSPDADQKLINFNERTKKVSHKAAAEELNKALHTNRFTPAKCEKRWKMLK